MITFELDKNNNIVVYNGEISLLTKNEALAQDISRQLNLYKGENIFNTEKGIDWDNNVLGKMGGFDYIKNQIINRILENSQIESIKTIEMKLEKNVLIINANLKSIYGDINI